MTTSDIELDKIPTAEEFVGLLESFIQGQIELKFAYAIDVTNTPRQERAKKHLEVLRETLVNQLKPQLEQKESESNGRSRPTDFIHQ